MSDALEQFRSENEDSRTDAKGHHTHVHTLLLFACGGMLYGVPAHAVDAVVAWRDPSPLPAAVPGIAGVVQDRGRIVAVLTSPLGADGAPEHDPRRLVICHTARGFLGLPATETRKVGPVALADAPSPGVLVDSPEGAVVFVDPAVVAQALSGARA